MEGLTNKVVSQLADQYEDLEKAEEVYQKQLTDKIKELEKEIRYSMEKSIYKLIYRAEHGDYRRFVRQVAGELVKRGKQRRSQTTNFEI